MNKQIALEKIRQYLKSHFITFQTDIKDGVPRYTMIFENCENSPNKAIESCIWFFEESMEVRTYFTEMGSNICRENKNNLSDVYRLMNYLNAQIWPATNDGYGGTLYKPYYLYTPRFYITEDDCYDITMTFVVPYDFYSVAPLETEDFITASCPELLNALSPAIFSLILGNMTVNQSITYVKAILQKE